MNIYIFYYPRSLFYFLNLLQWGASSIAPSSSSICWATLPAMQGIWHIMYGELGKDLGPD